jgi:hypothetical protein
MTFCQQLLVPASDIMWQLSQFYKVTLVTICQQLLAHANVIMWQLSQFSKATGYILPASAKNEAIKSILSTSDTVWQLLVASAIFCLLYEQCEHMRLNISFERQRNNSQQINVF